jgi:RluA family pseudouridine synthase
MLPGLEWRHSCRPGETRLASPRCVRHPRRVAKPMHIQFPGLDPMPILFEDRTVLAIDKPAGWMLIPFTWQRTNRNLQAAIESSIAAGHFWARSRNVKYLRHVHRLDAETTGILLFARSQGALNQLGDLFEQRLVEKVYLAVASGEPRQSEWVCRQPIGPVPKQFGRMQIDVKEGKPAETAFKVLETRDGRSLIECRPVTGRTHQIRVHLLDAGLSIIGDPMYGAARKASLLSPGGMAGGQAGRPSERGSQDVRYPMGLRAMKLGFLNPFTRKQVFVKAPPGDFLKAFGFEAVQASPSSSSKS